MNDWLPIAIRPPDTAPGLAQWSVARYRKGVVSCLDTIAAEEPLEVRLSRQARHSTPLTVTMRTPGMDKDLVRGWMVGEGIVNHPDQIIALQHCGPAAGGNAHSHNVLKVTLAPGTRIPRSAVGRHGAIHSSCGACGKADLDALSFQPAWQLQDSGTQVAISTLMSMPQQLRQRQPLFAVTGGVHGAALFSRQGTLEDCAEDVGRHNALDKLIGRAFKRGLLPLDEHVILVSGRVSFELVQKSIMAGCPILAAVGAPSSLALQCADRWGLTVAGFLNDAGGNVYTHHYRIGQ